MRILVDNRISKACKTALEAYGNVINIPSWGKLPLPISSHPDILFYPLSEGKVLMGREYYRTNKPFFDDIGADFVMCDKTPSGRYPYDVLFDALGVRDTLYGKEGFVSDELLKSFAKFVPVKQGYTRCSVAMLSDSCAVTADRGISAALKKDGISVLDIRPGHIRLDGYDSGFIGGAGGRLRDGLYCFFGSLTSHPDGEAIIQFASEHKIKAVSLSDEPLSDNGGLLVI